MEGIYQSSHQRDGTHQGGRLRLSNVENDAATTLLPILLPGEGSGHGPIDANEFEMALPAFRAGWEVAGREFRH